jgi:hypothetical protein
MTLTRHQAERIIVNAYPLTNHDSDFACALFEAVTKFGLKILTDEGVFLMAQSITEAQLAALHLLFEEAKRPPADVLPFQLPSNIVRG